MKTLFDKSINLGIAPAKRLEESIKIYINTNLRAGNEFDGYLIKSIQSLVLVNCAEVQNGIIALDVEYNCDLDYVQGDMEKVLEQVEILRKAYYEVGNPEETINLLESKVLENAG